MSATSSSLLQQQHASNSSTRAGHSLGFDLQGSLAAIDKWVQNMDEDEDDDDDDDDESPIKIMHVESSPIARARQLGKANAQATTKGILSREEMMNLCTGGSKDVPYQEESFPPQQHRHHQQQQQQQQQQDITKDPKSAASASTSESTSAVDMSDTELLVLLRKPPKATPALRTKSGF